MLSLRDVAHVTLAAREAVLGRSIFQKRRVGLRCLRRLVDDHEVQPTEYGDFGKIDASIIPLRWGRFVTQVVRTVTDTVQPGDSIAFAHVHKDITGTLKIRAINGVGDTVTIEKPFHDQSDRNVIFKRVSRDSRPFWLRWLPVATSLVDGGTVTPGTSVNITKLQMFLPNGDTLTVTDPLNTYLRYRWRGLPFNGHPNTPELQGGDRIVLQATVESASPDTDIVVLRFGRNAIHHKRVRMQIVSETNNGGVYTRVYQKAWFCNFHPGFFNAAVDALTKATLFDDDPNQYSVSWWGIPYRVQ